MPAGNVTVSAGFQELPAGHTVIFNIDSEYHTDSELTANMREYMLTTGGKVLDGDVVNPNQPVPLINTTYLDYEDISGWAVESIQSVSALGLLQGSNGKFSPRTLATKAEGATVIARLIELLSK